MSFLSPWALFGLGLLAIPVIVHLFKPRRVRQTPFSSLRWLHLTQQRMARRIQWHQVVLFVLRAAFLMFMVLALARPIWSPAGTAAGRDRILVLDISRSMHRHVEGHPSPWETAQDIAAKLVRQTLPGDRTAILLAGRTTDVLAPWTFEGSLYLPALAAITPSLTETQLDSAIEPVRVLLSQRRTQTPVEVVFLTDNPANGWNSSAIGTFAQEAADQSEIAWRLIDVSLPAPRNGWITAAKHRTVGSENVLHVEAASLGDASQPRTLRVTGLSGVDSLELPVVLEPGRRAAWDLPLPTSFLPAGSQAVVRLEPADELPEDDTYYVDLGHAGSSQYLLIEPIRVSEHQHRPGLALESAIRALAETGSSAADGQLILRTPATVTQAEISAADVVLMADVPGLNEALAAAVVERVRTGAGLLLFLGPAVDQGQYNRQFVDPLHPSQSLLPGSLAGNSSGTAKTGDLMPWLGWNDRHPLLTGLVDPEIGDLAGTQSRTWWTFGESPSTGDEILATLADGTPLLLARQVMAGRVILVNASADDRWCDLPRRKSFVPLVDRLLTHLQSTGHRRQFTSGEPITITLPETFDTQRPLRVISPSGQTISSQLSGSAKRNVLEILPAEEPGFYRISAPDSSESDVTFVVQPGRGDSQLTPMNHDKLRSMWSPLTLTIERPAGEVAVENSVDRRVPLESIFIGLACLVFLAEMFLVHWLCPQINPAVSTSHHRRKGFVAPLRERQGASS